MMTYKTDQTLINNIKDGDTKAFETLVNRYKNLVFNVAVRMVSKVDADEVAQDVFLKIYQSISSFRGESKLSTWIYKITYRKCLDCLKKNKRHQEIIQTSEITDFSLKIIDDTIDKLESKERNAYIERCLGKLSTEHKTVITFFYFDELSIDEISKITGLTINNVKVKLFRARKSLAKILEDYARRNR